MMWYEWLPYVSTALAILGALWGFYRRALRPALRTLAAVHELAEAQLQANGGSSLVDRVADTQARMAVLEDEVCRNRQRLDALDARHPVRAPETRPP